MQRKAFLLLLLLTLVSVVSAAPAAFTLTAPNDDALIKASTDLTNLTWTASVDATTYRLYVLRISDNVRIGEVLDLANLTPVLDSDALTCSTEACAYTIDSSVQAMLTDGQYVWNVEAVNTTGTTEASNGPFFLTVNTNPIELLSNGGFETLNEAGKPDQTPWVGVAQTLSKVKCNNGVKVFANTGTCALLLLANGGALVQRVDHTWMQTGDTLTLKAAIKTNVAPAGTLVTVKINYVDPTAGAANNGRDKMVINLPTTSANYAFFTAPALTVDGAVKKAKVKVSYLGVVGKVLVDDVSLMVAP